VQVQRLFDVHSMCLLFDKVQISFVTARCCIACAGGTCMVDVFVNSIWNVNLGCYKLCRSHCIYGVDCFTALCVLHVCMCDVFCQAEACGL
jgi:hypothetical protein